MNLNFETCWDKMHALLHCCSGRIPHCMHKRALLPCCMGAAWLQWRFSNCMYVHRVPAAAAGTQSALAAIKEKFLVYQGHPWFWRILGSPPPSIWYLPPCMGCVMGRLVSPPLTFVLCDAYYAFSCMWSSLSTTYAREWISRTTNHVFSQERKDRTPSL